MNNKNRKLSLISGPYLIWAAGFIIIPLFVIIQYAFTDKSGAFTLENLLAIADPVNLKATIFSLEIALMSTIICTLLAYPLVLAFRKLHVDKSRFMLFILILPMWMNFILRILAWQMILSENGILNYVLSLAGLSRIHIANSGLAIMIGVVYDYLPYMVLPIFNAVSQIDDDIIEAARDLGGSSITVFTRIIFPLSLPGLMSGIVMVFVPSMTEFVIADILGGGKLQLVGNIIEQEFTKGMEWNLGSGLSVALMIFMFVTMTFSLRSSTDGSAAL